jgi:hypothetical protein
MTFGAQGIMEHGARSARSISTGFLRRQMHPFSSTRSYPRSAWPYEIDLFHLVMGLFQRIAGKARAALRRRADRASFKRSLPPVP